MNVYTRINNKLARFEVETDDVGMAQVEVRQYLAFNPDIKSPDPRVFVVIEGGKQERAAA